MFLVFVASGLLIAGPFAPLQPAASPPSLRLSPAQAVQSAPSQVAPSQAAPSQTAPSRTVPSQTAPSASAASQSAPASVVVTLADAMARARARSPLVHAAREREQASGAARRVVSLAPNPFVELRGEN